MLVISDNKYLLAIHSFSSCQVRSGKRTLSALEKLAAVKKKIVVCLESDLTLISRRKLLA